MDLTRGVIAIAAIALLASALTGTGATAPQQASAQSQAPEQAAVHEIGGTTAIAPAAEIAVTSSDEIAGHRRRSWTPPTRVPTPAPVAPATGSWLGEYYNNTSLSGSPDVTRSDGDAIDFDWWGSPVRGIHSDYFSVRWTRTYDFAPGTYEFSLTHDDGGRLFVDGQMVMQQWYMQVPTPYAAQVDLAAGPHTVVVEYYTTWGRAVADLSISELGAAPAVARSTETDVAPTATDTVAPTATKTKAAPTATSTSAPAATTKTDAPAPTDTPTSTSVAPTPTETAAPTSTSVAPTPTETAGPTATETPAPTPARTSTPVPPTATQTPAPTATRTPTPTVVPPTATRTPTRTPVPPTATPTPSSGSGGSVQQIIADSWGSSSGHPYGVPSSYSYYNAPYHQEDVIPSGKSAVAPWIQIVPSVETSLNCSAGARVEISDWRAWEYTSSGSWNRLLEQTSGGIWSQGYSPTYGSTSYNGDYSSVSGGWTFAVPPRGALLHATPGSHPAVHAGSRYLGAVTVRITGGTCSGLLIDMGGDWRQTTTSNDAGALPPIVQGAWRYIPSDGTPITVWASSVSASTLDNNAPPE